MVSRDWDIDDYIGRLMPDCDSSLTDQFAGKSKSKKHVKKHEITDSLLEDCYVLMADIIDRYGNAYLSIFERLHVEIETREKQKEMLRKAKLLSRDKPQL